MKLKKNIRKYFHEKKLNFLFYNFINDNKKNRNQI